MHRQKQSVSGLVNVVFVSLAVRMEQLGSHRTGFYEICVCVFFKSFDKIQVLLKRDKSNKYFASRPMYIYACISLNSS